MPSFPSRRARRRASRPGSLAGIVLFAVAILAFGLGLVAARVLGPLAGLLPR